MGACLSSGGIEVSEEQKKLHREAEKQMKEVSTNTTLLVT
jgi:guanine nucleotide-binding protein subunit alpha